MPALYRLGVRLALACAALLALVAALLAGLWVWSASQGSLDTASQWAARWLARDGQTLALQHVAGTLRQGGTVGLLQWQRGTQALEVRDLRIAWDWHSLQQGRLRLPTLSARLVRYTDTATDTPSTPPTQLHLPLPLDVQLDIGTLEIAAPSALHLQSLQGHYRYDGSAHTWDVQQVQMAAGSYRLQGSLQATAPMALRMQLQGTVPMQVPGTTTPLLVQATAEASGTLALTAAVLELSAELKGSDAVQASVQARILPWQAQALVAARAKYQGVNLAALWSGAPQTLLSGSLAVTPQGAGWQAVVQATNTQSGPWDQQRVPVKALEATLRYQSGSQGGNEAGQWLVQRLQAEVAGGTVQAQGTYGDAGTTKPDTPKAGAANTGTGRSWRVELGLQGVQADLWDTRLARDRIRGQVLAHADGAGVAFEVALTGEVATGAQAATAARVHFKSLRAAGQWHAPTLNLDTVALELQDAAVRGSLRLNTRTAESSARLQAQMPGALAEVDGSLGQAAGAGSVQAQVPDLRAFTRWAARLPLPLQFPAFATGLEGDGGLQLRWAGGWQDQGAQLQVQGALHSTKFLLHPQALAEGVDAGATAVTGLRADFKGTAAALEIRLQGQATTATHTLALQSLAQWHLQGAGFAPAPGAPAQAVGGWRWAASLDSLQLTLQDLARSGVWAARLDKPVVLQGVGGTPGYSVSIAPGSVQFSAPVPGVAQVQWQAANWSQIPKAGAAQWHTQGRMTGLPMAWLEWLGQAKLANLGLRGDVVFGGAWDARMDGHLSVRVGIQRERGDLQLMSQDQTNTLIDAGLGAVQAQLQVDDEVARLTLGWGSQSAGSVTAAFTTRLQHREGWAWPADAPLAGTVSAQLPRVGVWSLLAPPGWRMQGTLDAQLALSGTRALPDWRGTVQARDMAIRSVVDGVDFSRGVMRLQLQGQSIDIAELSLQGAGASATGGAGGRLDATGQVVWTEALAATAPGSDTLWPRLRMQLEAQATQLVVRAQADQRLVVSGKVAVHFADAKLTLRGALLADEARFVLRDDAAPVLGSDVVVRPSAKRKAGKESPGAVAPRTGQAQAQTAAPVPGQMTSGLALDAEIALDPGTNFRISGQGLETLLTGKLVLRTEGKNKERPRLSGELRTVGGTYKAYGQALDIDTGVLRFTGAYDNPALDILALRPNLQQAVGVQISGTVKLPVVRLYSDPDMPEAEKLSWLVLGRGASASGADYALLQTAALAFVAGRGQGPQSSLIKAFGLDEVSLGEASTTNADGTAGSSATTVKLGKRLSRDFYVAYERSIATTLGTFYVFYDLSRRLTLRAQSGNGNALDLIFTTRFD